jgi:Arc/MetJ family transcription regulator
MRTNIEIDDKLMRQAMKAAGAAAARAWRLSTPCEDGKDHPFV